MIAKAYLQLSKGVRGLPTGDGLGNQTSFVFFKVGPTSKKFRNWKEALSIDETSLLGIP